MERREGGRGGGEAKKQKQSSSLKYAASSLSPRTSELVTCFLLLVISQSLLSHPGLKAKALLYLLV